MHVDEKVMFGGSAKINPGLPRRLAINTEVIFGGPFSLIRVTARPDFHQGFVSG